MIFFFYFLRFSILNYFNISLQSFSSILLLSLIESVLDNALIYYFLSLELKKICNEYLKDFLPSEKSQDLSPFTYYHANELSHHVQLCKNL